jgi:hypothetical protein
MHVKTPALAKGEHLHRYAVLAGLLLAAVFVMAQSSTGHRPSAPSTPSVVDPGPRGAPIGVGGPIANLSPDQMRFFTDGSQRFVHSEGVANGLGPTFNADSCGACHSQPAIGGTSPSTTAFPNVAVNPQVALATANGGQNKVPFFVKPDQFTATVSGTTNSALIWSATGGTVLASGLYTAPSTSGTYNVTATSVADTTKSACGGSRLGVVGRAGRRHRVVSITISPTSASLLTGGKQQFTATVTGSTNNVVTWSATGGTITSAGLYTAGQTVGSYTVTATSAADSTKAASSTVTVVDTTACSGTCYYVSPTGSDSNLGTSISAPWQTISRVQGFQSNLKPGDSVLLQRGGVWYEQLDIVNMNGSSGSPITIGNYGTGNLPVIDGGQTNSTQGRNYCIDAINTTFKWITVDGIECRNAYRQGITFQAYSGTGINGLGIVVKNSYIHHAGATACTTCGPTPASDPGGYVNQLDAQRLTGVQFLNNTIDHCGGHNCLQVHYDNGSAVVSGNVVGTNAPWCNHNCIDVKGGMGTQVTNNVVTCPSCTSSTAAFYTENTGYAGEGSETITYMGNTAYTVPIGFQAETGGSCSSSPCSIDAKYYNNTLYNSNSSWFNFMDTSCSSHSLDLQKNIVDGGTTDIHSNCTTTWDYNDAGGLYPISGNPSGPHDLARVNPQYVNASAGNFTPQNTTILTYGTNDSVTPAAYLGAAH